MNKTEIIKVLLQSKTKDELKVLVGEYQTLQSTGVLSPDSEFHKLTNIIALNFGTDPNLSLTTSFLMSEVFERFLQNN